MSRVAKNPIAIPKGVTININGQLLVVKGQKGALERQVPLVVKVVHEQDTVHTVATNNEPEADALAGSLRALIHNMVVGVTTGFERKLELVGVGYRAQVQGKTLNLTLGFSHPVNFPIPHGITIETPS